MQKIRGIIVGLLLSGLLAGCQSKTSPTAKPVQPTTSTVHAVQSVTSRDFLGRWVSKDPATSLYLNTEHQLGLFQAGKSPARNHTDFKLDETQLTVKIKQATAVLTLNNANSMTLDYQGTATTLVKDPNWRPNRSKIPTSTTQALKTSSLTPTFKVNN
ncbi:hypothetical protein [Lactiplantibacillus pentosus]|uniref:hypothetical protein n=1 Tax=Lactiplantibacillus pentosus TaxID=1589 RepID=UPI001ADDC2F6|nr:hypothetical protein [Lactiplantibacillus pentosus]MBO9165024.1 hypothetical protein [Lactiplantibacillus pentosus]